jgi:CheY-like chemotaxis protein
VHRVLYRLNLGERQYYRDHNKAVQVLSRILMEQVKGLPAEPDRSERPDNLISIQSEIQRLHNVSHVEHVDIWTFLQKTLTAIHGLTEHYHATVTLHVDGQPLRLANDSAVLRQAIIWLLSQLIIQSGPNQQFTLSFAACDDEGQFTLTREKSAQPVPLAQPFLEQQETLRNLVEALESRVEEEVFPGGGYQVRLTVPLRKHAILIIDDNPDVIALFRRYLAGYPYLILTTDEADSALRLARDSSPELIVLDVLLPQRDGWEILQSLKSHPLTRHIPVLVCSVLASPELARVLGADGFLQKPPGETEFLKIVAHLA